MKMPISSRPGSCVSPNNGIRNAVFIFFMLVSFLPLPVRAGELPHHDLTVSLDPEKNALKASDTITVPKNFPRTVLFALHAGLNPSSADPDIAVVKKGFRQAAVPLELFAVTIPQGATGFTVIYGGTIYHPLTANGTNQARGFDQTAGSIADEGVYLAGSSAWYPLLETDFITFAVSEDLPGGWDGISQGRRTSFGKTKSLTRTSWDSAEPQEEIYLIASRYTEYQKKSGNLSAMVYLRRPDESLANKYLDATIQYVGMYDRLIGPYPYEKFALVENFWETGFGMPSFTLLGSTVLRLPFIINTSYPHEILHNWWGNSVYPVYEKGNWSEGLTAYLADHLLKEQQGAGAEYRLNALQKYADYVLIGRDFPLTQFRSRHSPSTEAVGYGKALMFFHMLRLELGDQAFTAGVRDFYRNYKFHFATFDDIEKTFAAISGKDLKAEFDQWVTRPGAPEIRLRRTDTEQQGEQYLVSAVIEQVQQGDAYRLRIPVAVTLEGRDRAFQTVVGMDSKKQTVSIKVPSRPVRLDIDPEFDVFRRLAPDEIPPAISQALGAKKMLVILPSSAEKHLLEGYRALAKAIAGSGPDQVDVKMDTDMKKLPSDRSIAVLGWENRFLDRVAGSLEKYAVKISEQGIRISDSEIARRDHSVVFTARNPGKDQTALMFVASDRAQALPGLGRKLPHYHKYSYLAFEGDEPANIAKGRWPVLNSPLTAFFPDKQAKDRRPEMGKLAPREALASLPPVFSEERMRETIKYLSSDELKGREIGTPEIDQAADYISRAFKNAGLVPGGDAAGYFQMWKDQSRGIPMKNVIGVIPGKKRELDNQSVVVGAHYDHLGTGMSLGRAEDRGQIHPGADDNGSGVAVLLELARVLKKSGAPDRSIVFVSFTGEEEGKLGSAFYVKNERTYPVSKCTSMVNLDTVGRLGKKKLIVLGSGSAKEWVHIFRGAGFVTGVDTETVSEELDSSDQKSFQEAGVPAVQLFSGAHLDYHRPTDTADKIDPAGLVKIAAVAKEVVEYLANREEPLTATVKPGAPRETGPHRERTATLGTMPDYTFSGRGVRLSGVVQGSPAEAAGLQQGDVIININRQQTDSLKDFAEVLKKSNPGDIVSIVFLRDGTERTVQAKLKER